MPETTVIAAAFAASSAALLLVARHKSWLKSDLHSAGPRLDESAVVIDAKGVRHVPSKIEYVRETTRSELELRVISELINVAFYEADAYIFLQGYRFRVNQDGSDVRDLVETPHTCMLVYEDPLNRQIQGCVWVQWDTEKDVGHFFKLAVPLLYSGRGVGPLLVQAAQLLLKSKLSPKGLIRIHVVELRKDIIEFYSRRGFVRTGPMEMPQRLVDLACPEFRHYYFEHMEKPISKVR